MPPRTQHPLYLALVGSHLHPEFLPQNSMKGCCLGALLATGGPEQSHGCGSRAQDDLAGREGLGAETCGNQDSLSHGGGI